MDCFTISADIFSSVSLAFVSHCADFQFLIHFLLSQFRYFFFDSLAAPLRIMIFMAYGFRAFCRLLYVLRIYISWRCLLGFGLCAYASAARCPEPPSLGAQA